MNRIKLGPLATLSQPCDSIESGNKILRDGSTANSKNVFNLPFPSVRRANHTVFVPLHYERNYSYPLVVWLHANGEDSQAMLRMMPDLSIRNYVAFAPEAPVSGECGGYSWRNDVDSIYAGEQSVYETIDDACSRLNIASERIFLIGSGAGGTMAFRVAFQRPELFAGVLSLNGALPSGETPLSRLNACRRLPVFWAHCRKDESFSEESLCNQLRLLHIAGFAVTLRQYPCGLELMPQILGDSNSWIMEIINGYKQ
ncbi:hypothetical protein N9242_01025 [Vicingaceae bacterium]|nr:hypothetical protein [Vicingaceae bacterium]